MVFFVVHAPNQLSRVFRTARDPITIGRATDAELTLPNISVSRLHARLSGATLENLEPANPVFVNGAPITAGPLGHGDEVRIGKHRLVFCRSDPCDPGVGPCKARTPGAAPRSGCAGRRRRPPLVARGGRDARAWRRHPRHRRARPVSTGDDPVA
ncbi:MAG: pSer/pThr/pTyr-binding forkhead associated (FHA) protein, partial [Myxococcota bacterium]